MNKKVIIIMGPPGSGKGTQSEIISGKFGYYYLESSKIIDAKLTNIEEEDFDEIDGKKYFLAEQKRKREGGEIMAAELVTSWMEKKIKELSEEGENLVIAGSPRTLYEAEKLMPLFADLYGKENIVVVSIDLSEEEAIFRSVHRRICSLVRHPILYYEETKDLTVCPLDGSKLITRKDDNTETVRIRMQKYREETLPALEYSKREGYLVKEVVGKKTPAELHYDILKVLE